jgi:excisionase family DNA binding protein
MPSKRVVSGDSSQLSLFEADGSSPDQRSNGRARSVHAATSETTAEATKRRSSEESEHNHRSPSVAQDDPSVGKGRAEGPAGTRRAPATHASKDRGTACAYLLVEDVAERLHCSTRTVHELTRTNAIPHRRLPGTRRCLFREEELEAWESGSPLEVTDLPHGGRLVVPRRSAA